MMLVRSAILLSFGALFALACGGSPAPGAAAASAATAASATTASAAVAADGGPVSLPNGGSGWLQAPTSPGKHPALLVIPEWWGLNDWIKQDVARFASKDGYDEAAARDAWARIDAFFAPTLGG
jgi:hypothetical protein